jgi:hypothetical protein
VDPNLNPLDIKANTLTTRPLNLLINEAQRFNSINISLSSKQVSLTFDKSVENNQN